MILRETLRLARSVLSETFLVMVIVGLLLTFGYVFLLTTFNLVKAADEYKKEITLEVFLMDGIEREGIERIREYLLEYAEVSDVREKSPDDALAEMSAILGSDLTEVLGYNPLPYSLEVKFVSESYDIDYLNRLSADLALRDEVMEVHFASEWIRNLSRITNIAVMISVGLSAAVAAGVLFVFVGLHRDVTVKRLNVNRGLFLLGMRPRSLGIVNLIWSAGAGLASGVIGVGATWVLWRLFDRHVLDIPFFDTSKAILLAISPVVLALLSAAITRPVQLKKPRNA